MLATCSNQENQVKSRSH